MAIKYLDARRIRGSSTANNPVDEWGIVGTKFTPNGAEGRFDFTDPTASALIQTASYDIGSTQGNAWTLRMKVRYTTIVSGDAEVLVGLSDTNQTAGGDTNQDYIGVRLLPANISGGNGLFRTRSGANIPPRQGSDNGTPYIAQNVDTDYYLEIQRTSSTTYNVRWTTSSNFTGGTSYSNTSLSASITDLRYIKIMNNENSTAATPRLIGYITELKFWNSSDPSGTPTKSFDFTSTDEKVAITNVPVGTRYEETDTRKIFYRAGAPWVVEWVEKGTVPSTPPQVYMVMAGSMSGSYNQIDRLTIATLGNASAFGTLNVGRPKCTGVSNEVLGLVCGGEPSSATTDIESITIASGAQSADYGDLTAATQRAGGCSAATTGRGLIGGGCRSGTTNVIDYLAIGVGGTAADFGDLTAARQWVSGIWSDTIGVFVAGTSSNVMDYVTMATLGNATDFGDNTMSRYSASSLTNKTRGVTCGGYQSSQTDTMDYITIDTPSNATDFGNLESSAEECYCGGDLVNRGIIANADHLSTEIQYISIDTAGNSVDFGDLDTAVHDGCTVNGT